MWIIIIVTILLDGIIVYYVPSFSNNLNYFYPMLTVSLIPILYSYNSCKKFYKTCFIIGFIYDLLYSNIFLYHALIFLLIGKIDSKIYKFMKDNLIMKILLVILNIIIYDTIGFILIVFSHYEDLSINSLFYKISHSLLLNILSVFVYYFLGRKVMIKHKI